MPATLPAIYFIPGLGADARMYQLVQLDSHKFKKSVLTWLPPRKNESLAAYAQRMAAQIPEHHQPIVLVGVSFGGMLAVEISKIRPVARTILISSIKTSQELPHYLQILGKLNLHHYLPLHWAKKLPWLYHWIFGATTFTEKKMLREIIQDTDVAFVKWALTAIVNWQSQDQVPGLLHVHSNQDKIFPLPYIKDPAVVYSGGHLVIFSAALEISRLITQAANQIFYPE
ncbi:alpha/beta fold hydrolase [Adhaeribacter pallidiroseus]|uniref:AB hydrolase-1 domain-containing protein n=1 Tax=Adhaeribacter pallidiroseus TaxID=2072847 RepID=A0A369QA21_9BACT|nr:alpha/beta hydrolase [Adhaeribacter pallidiroseus]RDC61534.1 hypothetical protein AHMF7616_00113 [Adhaeribacter pallidiroseus]